MKYKNVKLLLAKTNRKHFQLVTNSENCMAYTIPYEFEHLTIMTNEGSMGNGKGVKRYELYEVSNENVSEGDLCLTSDGLIIPCSFGTDIPNNGKFQKIIKTTDDTLGIPVYDEKFLNEYCKYYNNKFYYTKRKIKWLTFFGKYFYKIFSSILYIISIILIFHWFNWKLLLIIFLFVWANNVQLHGGKKEE